MVRPWEKSAVPSKRMSGTKPKEIAMIQEKQFDPGLAITMLKNPLGFSYGNGCFGPEPELRKLDDIRGSLMDPTCEGPEIVYSIIMDVGKEKDYKTLQELHLLFGVVAYASGKLGQEPVRSQGHIHKPSQYAKGWSTPELYEIWKGEAIIYMQEHAGNNPGRCYAVKAGPGETVLVPPGWAHCTISASPAEPLLFGAWCDRDYGFIYDEVRKHKGLAWYPVLSEEERITWNFNTNYLGGELIEKTPRTYKEFNMSDNEPIYKQFETDPGKFQFISRPDLFSEKWKGFVP
jgi:glucose-6-phosphate isomerase, archaeal